MQIKANKKIKCKFTCTNDSSVFSVATVIYPNRLVWTLHDGGLRPGTLHIIQPDLILALAKEGSFLGLQNRAAV